MISARFERNLGFLHEAEQTTLQNATVSVAGAGGDGGMLSVQLARLGVQNFRLADPDPFEIENINRQAVCTDSTIGRNKAEAVADYIVGINPDAKIELFTEGVSHENARSFVEGSDLVIDETEFTLHALGISLARESRRQAIPQMTALNIGFGAIVTTYRPGGRTYENQLGFGDDQDIESIAATPVKLDRWLPYLPAYGDLSVLEKVASGEKSAPSIAPGVAMAASIGSTQAILNLLKGGNKRPDPVYAPKAIVVDAMSVRADVISYSRASHYRHLAHAVVRNVLKLNPKASY